MWFFKKENPPPKKRSLVAIRLEAIGGQGAHSAGKITAETAVLGMGYTGNHFSSFGSEKRGSPVRSFVRFSTEKKPVRSASFIKHPDVLVIFHESLIGTHLEVLEGIQGCTDVIINTDKAPQEIKFPDGMDMNKVICLNATKIAFKHNCGLNAVMLGALSALCPEINKVKLQEALNNFFIKLPEKVRTNNFNGFQEGSEKIKQVEFRRSQASQQVQQQTLVELGWANAPIGGTIVNPGNSILKDHSASRKGIAPRFTKDLCFNCGYCDMVCPDFCFVWKKDLNDNKTPELQGIDYQYCKGCQKCITVCPVQALTPIQESELTEQELSVHLFKKGE